MCSAWLGGLEDAQWELLNNCRGPPKMLGFLLKSPLHKLPDAVHHHDEGPVHEASEGNPRMASLKWLLKRSTSRSVLQFSKRTSKQKAPNSTSYVHFPDD